MHFTIRIEPEAKADIQEGIDWYTEQGAGLGNKFHATIKAHFEN